MNIIISAAIVGMLFILFYIPYLFAKGVSQMAFGKKLDAGTLAKCWVPIYNIFYADKTYFGKLSFASYGFIGMLLTTLLRVTQWYFMYNNEVLARVCIILFLVGIAAWYITNVITSYIVMHESGVVSVGKAILYSIIFPFGYFYIGQFMSNVIAHSMSERSDRSWDDDDGDDRL